mmetsp:Transcript_79317/g.119252  ORF Transcript_79317/g.119252 Transcript_79317/m.119252 type:complete len:113 (-) Transcript_79317:500-838(-)
MVKTCVGQEEVVHLEAVSAVQVTMNAPGADARWETDVLGNSGIVTASLATDKADALCVSHDTHILDDLLYTGPVDDRTEKTNEETRGETAVARTESGAGWNPRIQGSVLRRI